MASGTITGNTTGAWVDLTSGEALVVLSGTWSAATAKLQLLLVDGTTLDLPSVAYTVDTVVNLVLGGPSSLRASVTGGGSPVIKWEIRPVNAAL